MYTLLVTGWATFDLRTFGLAAFDLTTFDLTNAEKYLLILTLT